MNEIELDDETADRYLLDATGTSLLVFYDPKWSEADTAREQLAKMNLPVEHLCWVDASGSASLVERYEAFHLPSIFMIRDGVFYGPVQATLNEWDIRRQLALAESNYPAELP
ncbi:thioredoxin [Pollutimonas bauzanensis]|uniref:Thioredoxin n=1 Tax=Pollutimonas bauzanensis TaxID=658167 RepID=A0A1M5XNC8_9BURK|nr:thioredoxin [Pollutimonas bauzanensis]SHI01301.1 hypothetical protein SAMN04488135_10733 [Pollutimonas bauzanensis]